MLDSKTIGLLEILDNRLGSTSIINREPTHTKKNIHNKSDDKGKRITYDATMGEVDIKVKKYTIRTIK